MGSASKAGCEVDQWPGGLNSCSASVHATADKAPCRLAPPAMATLSPSAAALLPWTASGGLGAGCQRGGSMRVLRLQWLSLTSPERKSGSSPPKTHNLLPTPTTERWSRTLGISAPRLQSLPGV